MTDVDLTRLTSLNMSDVQKMELVKCLLSCVVMSDRGRRDAVIDQLNSTIAANISRSDIASIDVFNIVTTCLQYEAGLAKLIQIVRFFEGDSISMRTLNEFLLSISIPSSVHANGQQDESDTPPAPPETRQGRSGHPSPAVAHGPGDRASGTAERTGRRLKVFLSHASEDAGAVRDLYKRLTDAGVEPWLDEEDLLPGQKWQDEIPRAVRNSDAIIVCVSEALTRRAGYIQKEINLALDVAEEQPEGAIFVIPVRLEECEVPSRLGQWMWVDLFKPNGLERLLRSLRSRAAALGVPLS